jgi:hypothetical protein
MAHGYEVLAGSIFLLGWTLSTLELPVNKTELLLEVGFIDVAMSVLKAFELRGRKKVPDANVATIWCTCTMLSCLDLTAPEAQPIVRLLEGIASSLRFMLDNDVVHFKFIGNTSACQGALVCALAFGKEEGGEAQFAMTQELIDVTVLNRLDYFSGEQHAFNPVIPRFFLKSSLYLCISDTNKAFLVHGPANEALMTLLIEALLLDPRHPRQNQLEDTKAAIQRDAAECFLQLALFEPGREMLIARGADVLDALRALADGGGWKTGEAKQSALGALIAIEGRSEQPETPPGLSSTGHIMMSYQWDMQVTAQILLLITNIY